MEGQQWEVISPDLSRESWDVPESIGVYKNENMKSMARREWFIPSHLHLSIST